MINLWIDFLSILVPSWHPKWLQNDPAILGIIDPEGVFWGLGTLLAPQDAPRGLQRPQRPPKVTSETSFLMILEYFSYFSNYF